MDVASANASLGAQEFFDEVLVVGARDPSAQASFVDEVEWFLSEFSRDHQDSLGADPSCEGSIGALAFARDVVALLRLLVAAFLELLRCRDAPEFLVDRLDLRVAVCLLLLEAGVLSVSIFLPDEDLPRVKSPFEEQQLVNRRR